MMRSMYSGVSGLKNHQTRMDVIGNNIANVNTNGYKKSRVVFQDTLYQQIRGASRPVEGIRGGTNAMGVGLGMSVSSIDQIHTPTATTSTNKLTDMAINGNGYFILKNGEEEYFSRAGAFEFDIDGNLISTSNGYLVQGWNTEKVTDPDTGDWVIDTGVDKIRSVSIKDFAYIEPKETTEMYLSGNLDCSEQVFTPPAVDLEIISNWTNVVSFTKDVYDTEGTKVPVNIMLGKTAEDDWTAYWYVYDYDAEGNVRKDGSGNPIILNTGGVPELIQFGAGDLPAFGPDGQFPAGVLDADGELWSDDITIPADDDNGAPAVVFRKAITFNIDFSKLTQYNAESSAWAERQDGYAYGDLTSYTVTTDGTVVGIFDNGEARSLCRVALAKFQNSGGLVQTGSTLFIKSNNSGDPQKGAPGINGLGTIIPSNLEMSNVDLSEEFTDMIVTQRGFQSNSRIITTSDEMIQELVNLKR